MKYSRSSSGDVVHVFMSSFSEMVDVESKQALCALQYV